MTETERLKALEVECAMLKKALKEEGRDTTMLKGALERVELLARHALEQIAAGDSESGNR